MLEPKNQLRYIIDDIVWVFVMGLLLGALVISNLWMWLG